METLPPLLHALALALAGFAAGSLNAIAGGGTNLSFPALLWLGLPPVVANATSAVALWPGSLAGAWGFRGALRRARPRWLWLLVPSIVGGVVGALLLVALPSRVFAGVAPWLVLASTLLFAAHLFSNRGRRQRLGEAAAAPPLVAHRSLVLGALVQLAIAVYGGYFGAGIGILMLASLGLSGVHDLAVANGLKSLFAAGINGAAIVYFVASGAVDWPTVPVMALGAVAGGWSGARVAQRLPPLVLRWTIVAIGLAMAAATFVAVR